MTDRELLNEMIDGAWEVTRINGDVIEGLDDSFSVYEVGGVALLFFATKNGKTRAIALSEIATMRQLA